MATVRARRAAVVGTGLIGGSLGLALRAGGWWVTGTDVDPDRARRALELEAVDAVGEDPEAEVVFVATPAGAVPVAARAALARARSRDVVVTDVAGVKAPVVAAVTDARFVGGHPMAGSEQAGVEGADAELFVGATWVLTPTATTDPGAYARLRPVLGALGADVVTMPPEQHDTLVAVVSHVPHLTAATLMNLADGLAAEHAALLRLAAGGFRDMTRVAAGDPAIWPDLCTQNADAIVRALDAVVVELTAMRDRVAGGRRDELLAVLGRATGARRSLPARAVRPERLAELRVPIPDRTGALHEVTTAAFDLSVNLFDVEIAHSAEGDRGVLVLVVDDDDAMKLHAALAERGYRATHRSLG